jgi:hypothetical protein
LNSEPTRNATIHSAIPVSARLGRLLAAILVGGGSVTITLGGEAATGAIIAGRTWRAAALLELATMLAAALG